MHEKLRKGERESSGTRLGSSGTVHLLVRFMVAFAKIWYVYFLVPSTGAYCSTLFYTVSCILEIISLHELFVLLLYTI